MNPYQLMQKAVDIVQTSEHPSNKIAAVLAGQTQDGRSFDISQVNFWPKPIKEKIGMETRIGNSSGTIHAETACILKADATEGASLFVTDLPCPNCVKNLAEAGIEKLYIDHKGFDKDFAQRRGGDFSTMSLNICEKAGISVYKIFRKEQRTEILLEIPAGFSPVIEKPARINALDQKLSPNLFSSLIEKEKKSYKDRPFAIAGATTQLGQMFLISAEIHPCPGYTSKTADNLGDKYSIMLQPVNRLIMTSKRYGLKIANGFLYSSRVPTAREMVNMFGSNLDRITIGDKTKGRDDDSLAALETLVKSGVLNVE